jgi:hypothetical protein
MIDDKLKITLDASTADNKTPATTGVFAASGKKDILIDDSTTSLPKLAHSFLEETQSFDKPAANLSMYGDLTKYEDYGVIVNPIDQNLDKQRARNQSALEQFGNSVVQGVVGEVIGGTIGGFGAIGDVILGAAFGEDNDYENAVTRIGDTIRESTQENFPIYQENPEKALDFGDTGYIFSRLPSVLSSISLLIPGAAVTKGLSKVGSLARISKLGKTIENAAKAGKYGNTIKNALTPVNAAKIGSYVESGITAAGMRIGENYQEARQTAQQVKEETVDRFSKMSDEEYNKFLEDAPKDLLEGIDINDKEAVADRIASKAAGRDFEWNLVNFTMDYLQLRGLSAAWKNMASRPASYTLRDANRMAANTINRTAEEIATQAQKSAFSRVGQALKRSSMGTGIVALGELSEGLEESVNYIASQEGLLYGRILNGQIDEGDVEQISKARDYLNDPMLYDSALWGVIGGVVFHGLAEGFGKVSNRLRKVEDVGNQQRLDEINGRQLQWEQGLNKINKINEGINPYELELDEKGNPTFTDGKINYKTIENEEEADYLRNKVNNEIISTITLNAIRNGNYNLLNDYLASPELKQRLIEVGYSSEENYEADNINIRNIAEETMSKYKSYSELLHNADVEDMYLSAAISQNISNDNVIKDIDEKINNLRSKNDNIASNNPLIFEQRTSANLDNRFRIGILQDYLNEINNDLKDKPATLEAKDKYYYQELESTKEIVKAELDKSKTFLSPLEAFKAQIQEDIFSGRDKNEIQKDIDKFKEENPNEDFNAAKNIFSLSAIETFAKNVNKDYIDNLYDTIALEVERAKIDSRIIRTQAEAVNFKKELEEDLNRKKDIAIRTSKQNIQDLLKTDEREAVYNYLLGDDKVELNPETKKKVELAKQVLLLNDDLKYKEELDIEFNKTAPKQTIPTEEKLVIVKPPVEESNKPEPKVEAPPVIETKSSPEINPQPVKVSLETPISEEANIKFKETAINAVNLESAKITEQQLLSNTFEVVNPFTYKGYKYKGIDVIQGRYGTDINIIDEQGLEENITLDQLSYLVDKGYISSTGGLNQAELESTDIETDTSKFDEVKSRFDAAYEMIDYYAQATGRKKDSQGRTKISIEDMMRYAVDEVGQEAANSLYGDLRTTLWFMSNVNNSVVITDNKDVINQNAATFLNKISKPKTEEIKESIKKDDTPAILQTFVTNKIADRILKTPEQVTNYEAVMRLKKGDKVDAEINDKGAIVIKNKGIEVGVMPAIQVDEAGNYNAVNELWNYKVGLKQNGTNTYSSPFIDSIKNIITGEITEEQDMLLNDLENLRISINTNQFIEDSLNAVYNNPVYKDLISNYGVETTDNESRLRQANHILKLFGYNNNVDITMKAAYPIISQSLDSWTNKLGSNYSNLNNIKNNISAGKQLVVHNTTSGILIKAKDKNGKPKFNRIKDVIRTEDSDNFKLYFPTSNGLLAEGNATQTVSTNTNYQPGSAVMFTKDSDGRNVLIHLYPNSLNGKYGETTEVAKKISDSIYETIYSGIENLLDGKIDEFENMINTIRGYVGRGNLLKGITIVPTQYGYAINYENGHGLLANYKSGDINIAPTLNGKTVTYTTKEGKTGTTRYFAYSERNPRTTAQTMNRIRNIAGAKQDAISINYMKDAILNNSRPNYNISNDGNVYNDADGNFVIKLPNGEEIKSTNYKDFLLDNNLLTTDVDAVRDSEGNNLGNFVESGEGFGANKNIYVTLESKQIEEVVPTKSNESRNAIEQSKSLVDIANSFGVTDYNSILEVFDKLGVKVNPNILNNRGVPNRNAIYDPATNTISVYNKLFKNSPDRAVRILVHEGLHHYIRQINNYKELADQFKNVLDYYKKVVDNQTDEELKVQMESFLEGKTEDVQLEEFIVKALTNKDLINILNNINYETTTETKDSRSLFKKILDLMVELISNVANINDNTLLAEINNIFNNFSEQIINEQVETKQEQIKETNNIETKEIVLEELPGELEDPFAGMDIDDSFLTSEDVESDQRVVGSINSLINKMSPYEREQFDNLNNESLINIVCY